MKSKILFIILTISTSFLYATKHNHTDENEIRYYNATPLDATVQQQLREGSVWQAFLSNNPNWYVMFDENNKLPHKAFGEPKQLNGSSNADVLNFLSSTSFTLPTDLRFVNSSRNDKYINFDFNQFYNNIEVISSKVYAKLTLDNKLIAFGLDVYNDINISVNPVINENTAITAAQQQINQPITDVSLQEKLMILPIPKKGGYEYHLVYVVKFKTRIEVGPAHYTCYVDAKDATLLMRKNEVMYEAPPAVSSVSGDLYTTHPYNPSSVEKLKYLKANNPLTGTNYYTDAFGDVNIPLVLSTQVRYKLEGLYSDVQTNGSTPDIYAPLSAINSILFDNSNSTIQERTAYWAVNEVHDHLKNVFPSFTGLDSPMETNIDEVGSCNAFFNGNSINFFAEGNGCQATAKIPDVVYHEYGHAINSARYNSGSGMGNGALNEGFADVWAFTITNSPFIGQGWDLVDPTINIRDYQDRKVYPQDLVGEVHADGEIIAGCFWDTYLNLNNMSQTLDLFKYTFDSGVDGPDGSEGTIFTDILLEVLYADDNDANLTNGTPNDIAIISAFALHGITLISNAVINHTPVTTANANSVISINANIQLTYAWALGSVDCYYRLNTDTNWLPLSMSQSGSNYIGQIPSQVNGNIIAYYISLEDNYGFSSGITPFSANKTPNNFANVPYFIMIGYELEEEEDFDFTIGFWQTGDVSDNATTGLWAIGTPLGSFVNPPDPNTMVQPDHQHTPNGSNCAFTGNATSSSSGIGENDIDGGHTTLYSPTYDVTNYVNPAFSYWRWFTNNTGAEPNADWWQVSITGDGVNWESIENNLTSDARWRRFAFRVKDYISLNSTQVKLRFVASDSTNGSLSGGSLVEAAIDDLYLWDSAVSTSIDENGRILKDRNLVKITDLLGREIEADKIVGETTLFYIYDDGSVVKKIMLD
jgi:Zn-dependent metalloprotease